MPKYLKEILVPIEKLLLDPNNPRFIKKSEDSVLVPDQLIEKKQKETLARFEHTRSNDEEHDVTNIKELYDSMKSIGFVEIDRIVIRRLNDFNKFLVIEGNRRISTVKKLLMHYDEGVIANPDERKLIEEVIKSFKRITCMLLETDGLSEEQVNKRVNVILGIRHHGSLLEWEPLPSAYNIFNEYMSEDTEETNFRLDNRKILVVKNRLSISENKVKKALKTYIAYLQLRARFQEVKSKNYSLIEAALNTKPLQNGYFKQDGETFLLDEKSIEKINSICQFATRDSLPESKKKIIQDPKKFRLLGSLVQKRKVETHEAIKSYADDIINRVEDEDDIEMTLEKGVDELTAFINRKKWTKTLNDLIVKQEKHLKYEDYSGIGNDKGNKDTLKDTIEPLRKMMGV